MRALLSIKHATDATYARICRIAPYFPNMSYISSAVILYERFLDCSVNEKALKRSNLVYKQHRIIAHSNLRDSSKCASVNLLTLGDPPNEAKKIKLDIYLTMSTRLTSGGRR